MRPVLTSWLVPLTAVLLSAAAAPAGWLCVKNDTTRVLLIQDQPAGPLKRGKVVRLLPGESYREFQFRPGSKTVDVFDAAQPATAVTQAKLKWLAADVTFKLTVTADPATKADVWAAADATPAPAAVAKADPPKPPAKR